MLKKAMAFIVSVVFILGILPTISKAETVTTESSTVSVKYRTHVQNVGWQEYSSDGNTSGTTGKSLRLEGINVKVENDSKLGIEYTTHVQDIGWQDYVADNSLSGTEGKSKRLEAIKIKLTGADADLYDVYYRVHAEDYGWLSWTKNGEAAGTEGLSKRLEAIEIQIVSKTAVLNVDTKNAFVSSYGSGQISYRTHVQNYGWLGYTSDGTMSGTMGQSFRLEGINIRLSTNMPSGSVVYSTHVQNYGWMNSVSDGALSGTMGQSLRLEAIKINLTGEVANQYDVYYRVHTQNIGWMGWAKNGEDAGSVGYGYRLEAIEIKLVAKGGAAPGATENAFKHVHSYVSSVTLSPTCTTNGVKTYICNCGDKYTEVIPATGHTIGDWQIDTEPTATENGLKVRKCTICNEVLESEAFHSGWQTIGGKAYYYDTNGVRLTGWQIINGLKYYFSDSGILSSKVGVDVSHYQGTIDWAAVKAYGIDYAIIRVGYGSDDTSQDDKKAIYNMNECERLGIPYGVYLYSYALNTDQANSEASHILRMLNGRNPSMGVYLDIEDTEYYLRHDLDPYTNGTVLNDFGCIVMNTLKANGYSTGIYANLNYYTNILDVTRFNGNYLWLAYYPTNIQDASPSGNWHMWQYTSSGSVGGIDGSVDLNILLN